MHAVELAEQLDDLAVGIAVVGEDVVADAVPAGAPDQRIAVARQEIAGGLEVPPVAQLECDVIQPDPLAVDQVDGVVIGPAAQEREEVGHPVGHTEAQHVAIELRHLLHVDDVEGDVAELERDDALLAEPLARGGALREYLELRALRVLELDQIGNRRLAVAAAIGFQPVQLELTVELAEIGERRDLERQMRAARRLAVTDHDRVVVERGGEERGLCGPVDQGKPKHVGVVGDLAADVGRLEAGVADALDADHHVFPLSAARDLCGIVARRSQNLKAGRTDA